MTSPLWVHFPCFPKIKLKIHSSCSLAVLCLGRGSTWHLKKQEMAHKRPHCQWQPTQQIIGTTNQSTLTICSIKAEDGITVAVHRGLVHNGDRKHAAQTRIRSHGHFLLLRNCVFVYCVLGRARQLKRCFAFPLLWGPRNLLSGTSFHWG
jgi:hypothetical protein